MYRCHRPVRRHQIVNVIINTIFFYKYDKSCLAIFKFTNWFMLITLKRGLMKTIHSKEYIRIHMGLYCILLIIFAYFVFFCMRKSSENGCFL